MPLTTNNKIWYADTSSPLDIAETSATQATSVENALNLRSRYSFSWANIGQRNAQAGMIAGSTGYQVDTKTEYIYNGSSWQLKTPHAEFSAVFSSYPGATVNLAGVFSIDLSQSTSTTFVTPGTSGQLIITDPGIYAVSSIATSTLVAGGGTSNFTGRAFLDLTKVAGQGDQQRVSIAVGEDRGSISKPNLRTTTANTAIYLQFYGTTAAASVMNTRVSITRIG